MGNWCLDRWSGDNRLATTGWTQLTSGLRQVVDDKCTDRVVVLSCDNSLATLYVAEFRSCCVPSLAVVVLSSAEFYQVLTAILNSF